PRPLELTPFPKEGQEVFVAGPTFARGRRRTGRRRTRGREEDRGHQASGRDRHVRASVPLRIRRGYMAALYLIRYKPGRPGSPSPRSECDQRLPETRVPSHSLQIGRFVAARLGPDHFDERAPLLRPPSPEIRQRIEDERVIFKALPLLRLPSKRIHAQLPSDASRASRANPFRVSSELLRHSAIDGEADSPDVKPIPFTRQALGAGRS